MRSFWSAAVRFGMDRQNLQLGNMLKESRKKEKMTLQALSGLTGLSISYLSMLERGLTSPTVENLQIVCRALGITMADLFSRLDAAGNVVVRKQERPVIFSGEGYLYEAGTQGNRQMRCVIMTISDNEVHLSNAHVADEVGYVVSGSIVMTVSGVDHLVNPGDCIYIDANCNHSFRKVSQEDCVTIWVYGPAYGASTNLESTAFLNLEPEK